MATGKDFLTAYIGLHMGPNNLCYMSLFIFSLCRHGTLYKTLTSLSTVFRPRRTSTTTLKVAVSHFVFYPCGALYIHHDVASFQMV